jgi:AraC-like DNA-binding protein
MDRAAQNWLDALADPRCELIVTQASRIEQATWSIGPRCLNEHMLHAVIHDGHRGSVGDGLVQSVPGDLLWVPAGTPHHLWQAGIKRVIRFARLRFRIRQGGRCVPPPPHQPLVRPLPSALALLDQVAAEQAQARPDATVRQRALLVLLFSDWLRAVGTAGGLDEGRRQRLHAILSAEPARHWTAAELGQRLDLSPLHLNRLVKRACGMPLRRLVLEIRVRLAAGALEECTPIAVIAAQYGWRDPFLFSRQFRQVLGTTPSAWRRRRS